MTDSRSLALIFILAKKCSAALVLTDAMKNAGLVHTGQDLINNVGTCSGLNLAASLSANLIMSQQTLPGVALPLSAHFHHGPIILNYLSASGSKEETLLRTSLVIVVYTGIGALNLVSAEASAGSIPALVAFAQYMVSNSVLLILPMHYSFPQKLICSLAVSPITPKIVRGLSRKIKKRFKKFDMSNFLKIIFVAFNHNDENFIGKGILA